MIFIIYLDEPNNGGNRNSVIEGCVSGFWRNVSSLCLQDSSCSRFIFFMCERSTGIKSSPTLCYGGYEPRFGRCYYLNTTGANNAQAASICTQNGGQLMQIRNDAELDYLQTQYNSAGVAAYVIEIFT